MTINTIAFNPVSTTNAAGMFNVSSEGLIQGTAYNDPAVRNELAGGYLDPAETVAMWGGVGICEFLLGAAGTPNRALGSAIKRATNVTAVTSGNVTGFSVFDQNHAMMVTPQQQVPIAISNMLVNFYRFGSNARIVVKCDAALAATLAGGIVDPQVSWDFGAQQLCPFIAAYPANAITAASWASTNGGQVTFTTTTNHAVAVGDDFTISGVNPSGYNGFYKAITGTATNSLVAAKTANPGAYVSGGTLVAGGGALAARVIDFNVGNSMTVDYDPVSGNIVWNRSGTAAVILI